MFSHVRREDRYNRSAMSMRCNKFFEIWVQQFMQLKIELRCNIKKSVNMRATMAIQQPRHFRLRHFTLLRQPRNGPVVTRPNQMQIFDERFHGVTVSHYGNLNARGRKQKTNPRRMQSRCSSAFLFWCQIANRPTEQSRQPLHDICVRDDAAGFNVLICRPT